jgi:hypothetical protein
MSALLQLDQAGLSPGAPGLARLDGKADGSLVTCTSTGAGATTAMRLLWVPPGDVSAVATLAPTGDPKIWTFFPTPNVYGTYLVELVENAGLATEKTERRAFVVRTRWLGLVIPAFNERGDRRASLVTPGDAEQVDNNATGDPNGPAFAGWWRAIHGLVMAAERLVAPVRVTWFHRSAGGALEHRTYDSFAEAFAVDYPVAFESFAVHDFAPTFALDDPGPYLLDTIVRYVLRSPWRDAVRLPELQSPGAGRLSIERCSVIFPISDLSANSGTEVDLREATIAAALVNLATVTALECIVGANMTLGVDSTGAAFDRCSFAPGWSLVSDADTATSVSFVDCSFSASAPPVITFTDAAGTVRMDGRSKFLWDAAGGTVTNGTIVVEA